MKAYTFKITLKGSKPPIWRKVIIPADISFKRLHDTIQIAMGWTNSHLYQFQFKDLDLIISNIEGISIINNANNVEIKDPNSTKIDKYFTNCDIFTYIYDFNNWWEHKIEPIREINDYLFPYPQIIKAKGNCPPENCGGIYGYYDFLSIYKNKNHPEYEKIHKSLNIDTNYIQYDMDKANQLMKENLLLKSNIENYIIK